VYFIFKHTSQTPASSGGPRPLVEPPLSHHHKTKFKMHSIPFNSKKGSGNSLVLSKDPMCCIWKTASQRCSHSEGPKLLIVPTFPCGLNSPLLHRRRIPT
jgi:hypothetical protein